MDYGNLHLRINEILQEKGISKNQICKDLDIPRTNFNKYCRDGVCRFLDFNVSNSRVYESCVFLGNMLQLLHINL